MATEEGIVITVHPSTTPMARVKTQRSGACKSCSARHQCSANDNSKEMEVDAINMAHAKIGDRVVLEMETASLIKGAFLLYIFPILCMVVGAIIGDRVGENISYNSSAVSAIVAFLFLGISFLVVKVKGTQMSEKSAYRPKIIRILK